MTWTPSKSDLDWTRGLIGSLKDGGVWGCPAGFSAWIKVNATAMTFDGPINDGDVLPDVVPVSLVTDEIIASCMNTNRRIVVCLNAIGVRVLVKDGKIIIADPEWSL